MTKILILSILLVLVYQFDQIVRMVFVLVKKVSRGRVDWVVRESDHYVGTAVTIVTMPLLLYSVMVSDAPVLSKLLWLGGIYLVFAVVSGGVGYFTRQAKRAGQHHGSAMWFASVSVVGGMLHPGMGLVPWPNERERLAYAQLALLLSVPAFLGAVFKYYYDNFYVELSQAMDSLIVVMIGGLFLNIIIKIVEKHFKQHPYSLVSYMRVLVGLGVAVFLVI